MPMNSMGGLFYTASPGGASTSYSGESLRDRLKG
jgi:hypothetical protein